ncbi:MAG: hypothetical protein AB7V16_00270 [Vulcanibacillus sp.]
MRPRILIVFLIISIFIISFFNGCTQNGFLKDNIVEQDLFNNASDLILQEISKQVNKQVKDLTVEDLLSITKLSLDGPINNENDFEIIGNMKNLITLSLQNVEAPNFNFLLGLTELQHLTINHFKTELPLPSFEPLKKLTYLEFNDGRISDIQFLQDVITLRTLIITRTKVEDISIISSLQNLVYLNISLNPISHIEPVKDLPKLNRLVMMNLRIDDPESLSECESLRNLDIRFTNITSIKPLINLENLEILLLSWQNIEDLDLLPEKVQVSELPILG